MSPRRLFVPFIVAILASCTTARPPANPSEAKPRVAPFRGAVAVAPDGAILLVRAGARALETWPPGGTVPARVTDLPASPTGAGLRLGPEGAVVASADGAVLVGPDGAESVFAGALDLAGPERLARRPGGIGFEEGATIGIDGTVLGARLVPDGRAVVLVRDASGDSLFRARKGEREAVRIAGPFAEIDSFDVAPDGAEIVVAARREGSFDVGLVATEGSDIRWIGPDPLDERMVRWAPRGNKITFAIETPAGAVIRSVHIPTGFQLSVPLPMALVRDLEWDAPAERLAVLLTSADAGERVETMRFDGTERRTAVPPAMRGEGADQLAGVPGAVLFPPQSVRYNETLPLVIWESEDGAFAFHEGRARLQQNRRIGSVVVPPGATAHPSFWDAVAELAWADPERIFIVGDGVDAARLPAGVRATVLTRESGAAESDRITVVRSEPGPLEEFAVLWLGERLRGFEREHDGN